MYMYMNLWYEFLAFFWCKDIVYTHNGCIFSSLFSFSSSFAFLGYQQFKELFFKFTGIP